VAPFWHDFHAGRNVATHPNSGLHCYADVSGGVGQRVFYITWLNVGEFNQVAGGGVNAYTMQCVISEANDSIEFRYGTMPTFCSVASTSPEICAGLVGFSRGRIGASASVDPVSRDLSLEVPFSTAVEGSHGNLGLVSVTTPEAGGQAYGGRMFPGQSVTWNVRNVPVSAFLGVQLIDVGMSRPGFAMPTITAPGCMLSTTTNALLWEVDVLPPANVVGSAAFSVPAGFDGFELTSQYVVLNGLFGGTDLITQASNALLHTVGRQ